MPKTLLPVNKQLLLDVFSDMIERGHTSRLNTLTIAELKNTREVLSTINQLLTLQEQSILKCTTTKNTPFRFLPAAKESIRAAGAPTTTLNEREKEILLLIAKGMSNKSISDKLDLKISTIKWYSTSIYEKLCVENRTQAANKAKELYSND